ncbi:MAG: molybdenum cofactor guanylyltransferase [Pirellulales bacterium]|nr:molybdenum cofactor guanylyltransferase [Pirellulales bacterium]
MSGHRLLGIVLVGGKSSRMGRDKALATLPDGSRWIDHAVARIEPLCDEVCLSGHVRKDCPHRFIEDPRPYLGPAAGIAASLAVAAAESFAACLVTPVDMPRLTVTDLQQLHTVWQTAPDQLVCGRGEDDHHLQPLVAIYPTHLQQSLQRLAQSDNRSLLRWILDHDHTPVSLAASSCRNLNTPEDLLDHGL